MTTLEAIDASIRHWEEIVAVLEAHMGEGYEEIRKQVSQFPNGAVVDYSSAACALCQLAMEKRKSQPLKTCETCPLEIYELECGDPEAPWRTFQLEMLYSVAVNSRHVVGAKAMLRTLIRVREAVKE